MSDSSRKMSAISLRISYWVFGNRNPRRKLSWPNPILKGSYIVDSGNRFFFNRKEDISSQHSPLPYPIHFISLLKWSTSFLTQLTNINVHFIYATTHFIKLPTWLEVFSFPPNKIPLKNHNNVQIDWCNGLFLPFLFLRLN